MAQQSLGKTYAFPKDGTRISYQQTGHGPSLVVVHGSLSTHLNYSQLVALLAKHFTVYTYDRRGFGLSPYAKEFTLQQDVEDVTAVLEKTKAVNLFGYSLGSIIALSVATRRPELQKLAVYEPPLFPSREAAEPVMKRLNAELAEGKTTAALVTAMTGTHLGAPWFNALPRKLLEFMTKYMITYGEKEGQGGYSSFRELAPTLRHDGQVILEVSGNQEAFARITTDTLLLGGGKSSKFLKNELGRLEKIIPHAYRREIPNLEHGSAQNADLRGNPRPIAEELLHSITHLKSKFKI